MRWAALVVALVAGTLFAVAALATPDAMVTAGEPAPGGSVTAASQPIGDSRTVRMDVTGGLGKTTVVAEGGARTNARGQAVAACWFAGPESIPIKNARVKRILATDPDIQRVYRNLDARDALLFCMELVAAMGANLALDPRAAASAAGCRATPLAFRLKGRKGSRTLTLIRPRRGPRTHYTCTTVAGGIALTARARRGATLRRAVGRSVGLGVYKAPDGPPSSGELAFRFRLG